MSSHINKTSSMDEENQRRLDPIGGGAINEKKRHFKQSSLSLGANETIQSQSSGFDATSTRAHLWHALEGLDRYPNYLSRWSESDMDRLEESLLHQLKMVRDQKQSVLERRKGVERLMDRWKAERRGGGCADHDQLWAPPTSWDQVRTRVLDPRASSAIFRSSTFAAKASQQIPTVQQVLEGQVAVELDVGLLEQLMDEELFDVYSLPLLSPEFCTRLRDLVRDFSRFGESQEDSSTLQIGRRIVDLDTIGLGWINDLLFHLIVRPISRHLFRETELQGGDLDWRQGYVAGYSTRPCSETSTPRQHLVTHTDDSEVTLNLCLTSDFEGGELRFRGLRGTKDAGHHVIDTFHPRMGTALLHSGRHFHEVTPVTAGDRYALIIWARSWGAARATTCPCCWLNRRQDNSCVCGPRWN